MSSSNFKVLVVGGGPVGLTAAHALHKAGVDFLLLERRPHVVLDAGSNVVLTPAGLPAFAELDLLEPLNAVSSALGRIARLDHTGRDIGDFLLFEQLEEIMGIAPRVISRHDLTRVLYERLPTSAQEKLLGNKKLSDITRTEDGVLATCEDGTTYEASMVIGADGAHSVVRNLMRRLALSSGSKANSETPFLTTYRALWVRFPRPAELPVGSVCETHGRLAATQLFVGEETGVIGVYERMDKPTTERVRYTQADQDALVGRWGHIPVTAGPTKRTLRNIYDSRQESGLVSLEEGVVEEWSWDGRIVLAGDAAHKYTPSTGAGCNSGVVDVVKLVKTLEAVGCGNAAASPSRTNIASAFQAYQSARHAAVVSECFGANKATAAATWQTGVHKFIDVHIIHHQALTRFLLTLGARKAARTAQTERASSKSGSVDTKPWIAAAPQTMIRAH